MVDAGTHAVAAGEAVLAGFWRIADRFEGAAEAGDADGMIDAWLEARATPLLANMLDGYLASRFRPLARVRIA
jgi:hypothetical protein